MHSTSREFRDSSAPSVGRRQAHTLERMVVVMSTALVASVAYLAASKRMRERFFAFWWAVLGGRAPVYVLAQPVRASVLAKSGRLSGRLLEVGSGDGAQLEHLCGAAAPLVREVVCIEPNKDFHPPLLRAMASARWHASVAGIDVRLRLFPGTLHEFVEAEPTSRFDIIATWLVLCSVPDVDEAVADCARLLASPGGRLLYMEHVASSSSALRRVQQLVQPAWTLLGDGCQLCRDTRAALEAVSREGKWRSVHHEQHSLLGGILPMICGVCEAR